MLRSFLKMPTEQRGFTIIELLVTVVIFSVLATVTLPMAELSVRRERERELRQSLRVIREAIDAYKQAAVDGKIIVNGGASGYPPSLEVLVEGVRDMKSPSGGRIFFLRRIPRDPFSADKEALPQRTWGLRSYASSASEPKEGNDVYDVYSTSQAIGLNNVPYREW